MSQDPVRRHAEDLAGAASKEFDAVLERQRVAQAPAGRPDAPRSDTGPDTGQATGQAIPASGDDGTGSWGWLQRRRQEFQLLMQMLARGRSPQDPVEDLNKGQAQETHRARPGSADPNAAAAKVTTDAQKAADQGSARTTNAQGTPAGDSKKVADASKKQTDKKAAGSSPTGPTGPTSGTPAPSADTKPSLTRDARPGAAIKAAPEVKQAQGPKQQPVSKADAGSRKAEAPKSPQPVGDAPSSADQGKAAAPPGSTGAAAPNAPAAAPPRAATPAKAARTTKRAAARPGRAASTSGRTCPAAGRAIRAPGWYVVRKGDTLSGIARRHYGSARFYTRIRAANRKRIRSADRIYPCQRVYLPRIARR